MSNVWAGAHDLRIELATLRDVNETLANQLLTERAEARTQLMMVTNECYELRADNQRLRVDNKHLEKDHQTALEDRDYWERRAARLRTMLSEVLGSLTETEDDNDILRRARAALNDFGSTCV